jgi:hypothetical protein
MWNNADVTGKKQKTLWLLRRSAGLYLARQIISLAKKLGLIRLTKARRDDDLTIEDRARLHVG